MKTNRLRNLAFDLRAIGTILRLVYLQWYDKQEACWRVFYEQHAVDIDACSSAVCLYIGVMGLLTAGIGYNAGVQSVEACGWIVTLLGFVGVVICESGRGVV